ncbi:BA75_01759T0 [Komagataella pastoris]|uniref:BA75_01759T0 n=1 Tax=Komagataella pastoris TaxID=4922 RepID=A0A1B2J6N3_PICPA|nr:BA75_01759T0 [Komagataella pastoris]
MPNLRQSQCNIKPFELNVGVIQKNIYLRDWEFLLRKQFPSPCDWCECALCEFGAAVMCDVRRPRPPSFANGKDQQHGNCCDRKHWCKGDELSRASGYGYSKPEVNYLRVGNW